METGLCGDLVYTYTFITDWSGAKIEYTVHVDLPKRLDWIIKVGNRSHCLYRFLDNQKNTRSQYSFMCFDRFISAFESRDLSQADKRLQEFFLSQASIFE